MAKQLQWTLSSSGTLERPLGDSELAFFKNSSTGLGDMFLHLALRAPCDIMRRDRVRVAWSIIRVTHPLLMSKIRIEGKNVTAARFSFTPPTDAQDAVDEAEHALHYRNSSKDELIFNYMNGPRTLSNDHLSYLVISQQDPAAVESEAEYDLFMCAPHFTGDGTSLHQSTHDLLALLASSKSDAQLQEDLEAQLECASSSWSDILPPAFETRLPAPSSRLARAACKVNYLQTLQSEIGGHVLPRIQHAAQRTRLIEYAFSEEQTRAILSACKRNGVSVNNALFALCSIAWARAMRLSPEESKLPIMIYTAINLRPYLSPTPLSPSTYWFLALTYFNVVLPAFPPAPARTFWHRARLAKAHTAKTVQSPFLSARSLETAAHRRGTSKQCTPTELPPHARTPAPVPSRALLGLSLIGNLDRTYTRASYCSGVRLHSVTTASRQKAGGLLVLAHTFSGRLWLHLCWDECGFEEGVVERWWEGVKGGAGEFLC